jgi:hypothetical protein
VNQNVALVNNLIFAGANLEMQDADGNTPLMIGIKNIKLFLIYINYIYLKLSYSKSEGK